MRLYRTAVIAFLFITLGVLAITTGLNIYIDRHIPLEPNDVLLRQDKTAALVDVQLHPEVPIFLQLEDVMLRIHDLNRRVLSTPYRLRSSSS